MDLAAHIMIHACAHVLWVILPLLPSKPVTQYLPINFMVDGSIYTDGKFSFLKDGNVALTVEWDGKKYLVRECSK